MIRFAILGLFLCQSVLAASSADVEAFQQKMAKEKPDTYARIQRAFGHRDVSMDAITLFRYQELLAKEGPLTIEFVLEKNAETLSMRVAKTANDGSSLCLFKAQDKRSAHSHILKLEIQEQTPFAQLEPDATGWQLRIDDGWRNKLVAHISPSGNLDINSGQGRDTLEIKTSALLTFTNNLTFSRISIETNQARNTGVLEVGELSLKQFDASRSSFTNAGYLQLTDLQIDKCTFFNENKITSQKQFSTKE